MKVKELIKLLKECDPSETIVIMSNDSEGNNYSPLDEISRDIYRPGSIGSGSLVDYEQNRQDGDIDVVTLWPTN